MKKKRYKYVPLNAKQCPKCSDKMVSLSQHDFVKCRCGAHFVDGGFDYMRATIGSIPLEWYKRVEL